MKEILVPVGFDSTDILQTLVTILFDEICKGLLSSLQAGFSTGKSCSLTLPDNTYIIIIRCPSTISLNRYSSYSSQLISTKLGTKLEPMEGQKMLGTEF